MTKYRVKISIEGFTPQVWRWYFPFWISLRPFGESTSYVTSNAAWNSIDFYVSGHEYYPSNDNKMSITTTYQYSRKDK